MTVKKLRKLLETVPEDVLVVVPGVDHSYREVGSVEATDALREGRDHLSEYYGEDIKELSLGGESATVVRVLVVR